MEIPSRVELTQSAEELLRTLYAIHGPLMFHQSGGCCDGSSPMCYPAGSFRVGGQDVRLGELTVAGIQEPIGFGCQLPNLNIGSTLISLLMWFPGVAVVSHSKRQRVSASLFVRVFLLIPSGKYLKI